MSRNETKLRIGVPVYFRSFVVCICSGTNGVLTVPVTEARSLVLLQVLLDARRHAAGGRLLYERKTTVTESASSSLAGTGMQTAAPPAVPFLTPGSESVL